MSVAGGEPVSLKVPNPPPDFVVFWESVVAEAEALAVQFERVHFPEEDRASHRVERLRWVGSDGRGREGWFAIPRSVPLPAPAVLYLPGYGVSTVPINENTAFERCITFSINLHGYAVVPNVAYSPELGYFTQGIESPHTYVYRRIMVDCLLAMRVLASQAEVDSARLAVAGLSQGGGLSVMMGAWCRLVRVVVAELPALTYWEYLLKRAVWRYPMKEFADYMEHTGASLDRLLHTLQYYDTVNHAPFVRVPVQVSLAMKDPGIRAPVVFSLYDALRVRKRLLIYEELGHDWSPAMRSHLEEWVLQG